LDLSARLVVLNGCETGMGEVFSGEGMLSMARGFIEAGAHSTITNLWQVNHASNAKLMRSFYTQLDKENSPSEALSKAKIDYLNDDEVDNVGAHPFYWSASVLIGTNSEVAIQNEMSYSVFLIVGIGLFVLSIFVLFYFRKQKR
jgi:CHAT domain-containing protein